MPQATKWCSTPRNSREDGHQTHQLGKIRPGGSARATKKVIGPSAKSSTNGI